MRACPGCQNSISFLRLALWTKFRAFACHRCGATVRRNSGDVLWLAVGVSILGVGALVVIGILTSRWSHLELLEATLGIGYVSARCFPRLEVEDPPL